MGTEEAIVALLVLGILVLLRAHFIKRSRWIDGVQFLIGFVLLLSALLLMLQGGIEERARIRGPTLYVSALLT